MPLLPRSASACGSALVHAGLGALCLLFLLLSGEPHLAALSPRVKFASLATLRAEARTPAPALPSASLDGGGGGAISSLEARVVALEAQMTVSRGLTAAPASAVPLLGAPAPALLAPAPPSPRVAPPLVPAAGASCVRAPLAPTVFTPGVRGHVCWENLYVARGRVSVLLPHPNTSDAALLQYLATDGADAGVRAMTEEEVRSLSSQPLPSLSSAHWMLEWPRSNYQSHIAHFIEGIMSGLFLEVTNSNFSLPRAILCSGCDERIAGSNGLNALIAAALWDGAPIVRVGDVNGSSALAADVVSSVPRNAWVPQQTTTARGDASAAPQPLDPLRLDWCGRAPEAALPEGRVPWALHIARACSFDRAAAHRAPATRKHENVNTELVLATTSRVQQDMDAAINRLRNSPLLSAPVDSFDLDGFSIRDALVIKTDSKQTHPLIVVQQRSNRRSFNDTHYAALVALLRTRSARVLSVRLELLPAFVQLQLAAHADVFVGAHGNGMAHLAWMRYGSGVIEIFPHFDGRHGDARLTGTGFTGHYPWLSRFRGDIYRSLDSELGAINPVGRGTADLSHQLNINDLRVNITAVGDAMDDILSVWRSVKGALSAGEAVDMTRLWNPHLTMSESR